MELFGINPEGGISLSSGAVPTPRQVDQIMKACAHMVGVFAYNDTIKKGLTVPAAPTAPATEPPTLKERKDAFYNELMRYRTDHSGKYPIGQYERFFKYWSETDKKGKMRKEGEKFFEIGPRLERSWKPLDESYKNELWKKHKTLFPDPPNLFS